MSYEEELGLVKGHKEVRTGVGAGKLVGVVSVWDGTQKYIYVVRDSIRAVDDEIHRLGCNAVEFGKAGVQIREFRSWKW